MKKHLFLILFLISGTFAGFAGEDSFFTTEVSLGTGISIYDSSADDLRKTILSGTDYKRIVAGLSLDTNLNISEPVKVMFGAELFSDFLWDKINYYNTIDYSLFTGIKFFPNTSGLNFSISYFLGNRTDFFTKLEEKQTEELNEDGTTKTQTIRTKNKTM